MTNEMLFRPVKQQIVSLNETLEHVTNRSFFVCECSRTTCADRS
jgi:transcription initiation factor IIE alpha subunit